jgi:hypothetical protein
MCFKNKNKYEKSPEQIAYEYGITISKEIVSDFFLGSGDNEESINMLLGHLESLKSVEYPPHCGTCNARFD